MSVITNEQMAAYHRDGYAIVRQMFDQEEITLLRLAAVTDRELDNQSFGRADGEGGIKRFEDDAGNVSWLDPERDNTARRLKMGDAPRLSRDSEPQRRRRRHDCHARPLARPHRN